MSAPFPLVLHLTRQKRDSIATLLAVLEAELLAGLVAPRLTEKLGDQSCPSPRASGV